MPPSDAAREIKYALSDVRDVLSKLGMMDDRRGYEKQTRGFLVRCPVHNEKSPSCSVQNVTGVILWKCHACDQAGDVLDLVAASRGLSVKSDFKAVLTEAAELAGLWGLVEELRGGQPKAERPRYVAPVAVFEPEPTYPPNAELNAFLEACGPAHEDPEVSAWIESRHLDAERVSGLGWLALRRDASVPWWASYRQRPWPSIGHRLIVPMRDHIGVLRSVRAGRICDGESPKRLPPGGHKAGGLVMVDDLGAAMLAGTVRTERFVIVEGETDFATWATRQIRTRTSVIGIVGGSWNAEFAARFPPGSTVLIRTDHDTAGERYAAEIAKTLRSKCFIRRSKGDHGRREGRE